ncbi:ABC transporter substrate-binding protein [Blastococcus brunescens]|uniref:ABC transporter substrate-binding protein n=1 Tax=Blastococcus brunescens TaxID=1564165 RepID=A0ABZ1B502_9ACTN|nr:ABC transporter substrate-binding protein [Blastococcus sp. BMG 8361]WRL64913.1 ABC transporter substrate-binding protein [Blastococcus sp. BMG 8361]
MSGLEVIDDQTFEVTLSAPFAQFPVTVGYTAFYPLPESFFEDPEAAGRLPIGNGPFQADGEFEPGQGITLSRYEDYAGENEAQADTVEMRVYSDVDTAYLDVQGGNLDVAPDLPPDAIASAQDVFGEAYLEAPSSGFQYLGYPTYDPRFSDPRVRQAFSMAIDREAISEAIFQGTRQPADAFIAPVVDGYREGPASTASWTSRRPTSCWTRPGSTAASRSSCGSTRGQGTTPGSRRRATRSGTAWVSTTSSAATSTSPSTCRCWTSRA